MTGRCRYDKTLAELEAEAHVKSEDLIEEQPATPPHDDVAPEDLDRQRLLGVTAAGRLRIR